MAKFRPGQSGNPRGRKPGSATRFEKLRKQLDAEIPDIIDAMKTLALSGDTTAAQLLMDRAWPRLRPKAEAVTVSGLDPNATRSDQARAVTAAMGAGVIDPDTAQTMLAALAAQAKVIEVDELEARIAAIEAKEIVDAESA